MVVSRYIILHVHTRTPKRKEKMLVYTDVFNNDELMSDSYPSKLEFDNSVLKVKTNMITKGAIQVDIGANPSTGGGEADEDNVDESVNDVSYQVNDVIDSFQLQQTSFDKKSFMVYIKEYMKRLVSHLEQHNSSRVDAFKKGAQEFVKLVVSNFDDYEFYTGESMDPEAMVIIMKYEDGDNAPYAYLFKDGLKEIKM